MASIADRIAKADANALSVLLSLRGVIDLPSDLWTEIEIRYIVAAAMNGERPAIATMFGLSPSFNEPSATGLDADAIEQFSRDALAAHDRFNDRIDLVSASLQNFCAMLSVSADGKSPSDVWDMLIAS